VAYSISGTITLDGSGLRYVYVQAVVDDSVEGVASTAVDGTYTISDLADATTYTVIPARAGYGFTPESTDVAVSGGDETDVDFTAEGVGYGNHAVPGSAEVEFALGQPPMLRVQYRGEPSDLDDVVLGLGAYAEVGGVGLFGGEVIEVTEEMPAGRDDARYWSVTFAGWEQVLRRRLVTIEAAATDYTVQDIVDDIELQVLGGENIAVGTIDGGATEFFYPSFIFWTAADLMDYLAEIIGGYWYIDPWPRELHLRTEGATSATWALDTTQDVWEIRVTRRQDDYANIVYVTDRTSWDTEGSTEYAVNATQIESRIAVEGGTGRHERVVNAPSDISTSTELQDEADALLARHDAPSWEIEYLTHETDLRVGMHQTVNLETEFGLPDATDMLVARVMMQQTTVSGKWRTRVTLTADVPNPTWERNMRQALVPGQKPRALSGTYGLPRYLRV
jgi:hypothetical protein